MFRFTSFLAEGVVVLVGGMAQGRAMKRWIVGFGALVLTCFLMCSFAVVRAKAEPPQIALSAHDDDPNVYLYDLDGSPQGSFSSMGNAPVIDLAFDPGTGDLYLAVDAGAYSGVQKYAADKTLSHVTDFSFSESGDITAFSIPEPSTLVLLAIGAMGLLAYRRRRRSHRRFPWP